VRSLAVDALLFAGVVVLLSCALGVLVMGSAYDRLHYASAAGWGALLVALAILVRESWSLIANKALLTAVILVVGGPVLSHATARAGRIRERGSWNPPREHDGRQGSGQ
jgi:monovalent cation/proton antiporter MnhG/PhaG subunit